VGGSALWQRGRARGLLDDDDEAAISVSLAVDALTVDRMRSAALGTIGPATVDRFNLG
jgi:hypothetical protein